MPKLSDINAIAEKWPIYIGKLGWDVSNSPFAFLAPGWTLLIIGNLYNLLGVNADFIKLANIFFYQLSSLLFFRIIHKPNANWQIFLKLFMFFPIFMFYSVSLLKELLILLLIILFVYSIKVLKSRGLLSICLVLDSLF